MKELAVQTIVTSGLAILFEVPSGISEATSSIIGNCIGANNVPLAKRFFRMTSKITLIVMSTLAAVIFIARN